MRRTSSLILPALLGLGSLAGCTDTPEVTAVNTDTGSLTSAEASIGAMAVPDRGFAALKSEWDAAWAAKDPVAYAANYTVHADFVSPR